jgi:hypothetical protein
VHTSLPVFGGRQILGVEQTCGMFLYRGKILGHNWDNKSSEFSSLRFTIISTDFTPPPLEQSGLTLVCNINIVYRDLKSENSEPVFVNVCGAQESIPRNRFRQPM